MRQIWMLEKLNFKISQGSMPPDPPSVLTPLAFDSILARPTLNCFHQACNYMYNCYYFFYVVKMITTNYRCTTTVTVER